MVYHLAAVLQLRVWTQSTMGIRAARIQRWNMSTLSCTWKGVYKGANNFEVTSPPRKVSSITSLPGLSWKHFLCGLKEGNVGQVCLITNYVALSFKKANKAL